MKEIWRDLYCSDKYEVSNLGNVRHKIFKRNLNPHDNGSGYKYVQIRLKSKDTNFYIHRLVATAFIPNPKGLPCVNHKDEIKANNQVDNLEWCTVAYNNGYGSHTSKVAAKTSKKVLCIETGIEYPSLH